MSEDRQERFGAYVEALAAVIGHADRAAPLRDYCLGLLLPGERKSVEPIAAVTAPARVSAQHQSLLHFVANAPWSNERVLGRIQELTVPLIEASGAIEAWIIDDTRLSQERASFGRGGASVLRPTRQAGQLPEPAPAKAGVAVSPGLRRGRLCRWPIMPRACRSPGVCICRWSGPPIPSAAPRPASP